MTLPDKTDGYLLQPGDGEAHDSWPGGGRLFIKATAQQTLGKFAAVEFAGPRSFVYGPRNVAHGFTVNSDQARVLLLFGPAGVEGFFREASAYLATVPAGEPPDPTTMGEIAARHGQQNVAPPMPPRD